MLKNTQKYFLAANSCQGFVSEFESNCTNDYYTYIIKGGPGTGKSSFMKKVAQKVAQNGQKVTLCPCSSDPESLDAVILEDLKIIIIDGTAPHTIDPTYPAVKQEILNFGEFWQGEKLENKTEIIEITNQNKALHQTASRYLKAAGELLLDNQKTATACLNLKKCEGLAQKIIKTFFEEQYAIPKENVRFLGGITPKGYVTFCDDLTQNFENLVVIEDDFFIASHHILNVLREKALQNGYQITTLKNPLLPNLIDHLLIPKLSLAVVSENRFTHFNSKIRRIHSRRFYDNRLLHQSKNRIKFNNRLCRELLDSAYFTLNEAKLVHDQLEKHYINAMNFEKLNNFADMFCKNNL